MTDLSQGASELDARLAEIDRKLRAIQVDLDPEREPSPSRPSPVAQHPTPGPPDLPPESPSEPAQEPRPAGRSGPLEALLQASPRSAAPRESAPEHPATGAMLPPEMHAKLVSAMRDLLDAYGWTLRQLPVDPDPQPAGEPAPVAMSVGPFANTAAVRAFEHELLRLPGVREVTLRGYEGENRAMFDVQLSGPTA
jgi:hypothetical protein